MDDNLSEVDGDVARFLLALAATICGDATEEDFEAVREAMV